MFIFLKRIDLKRKNVQYFIIKSFCLCFETVSISFVTIVIRNIFSSLTLAALNSKERFEREILRDCK